MKLCDKGCIPCCDFCIHVEHECGELDGKIVKFAPIGCNLHKDKEHQDFAVSCWYCEDFHCFNIPVNNV